MIESIPNLPDHVLGFTASGKVTGIDYESTIIPAVEELLKSHPKINLVYHIREDFKGYDAAAVWDDAKIGLKHLTSWNRIAVVTDVSWIQTGVKAVGFLMPCEVKLYPNTHLDEAIAWASETG
jgi:hypothetical protein